MAKNDRGMVTGDSVTYQIPAPAGGVQMETFIPWTLVKRGVRRQVITPIDAPEQFQREAVVERSARKHAKDSPLIRALGLAHYWQRLLDAGKVGSVGEIATMEGFGVTHVRRLLRLVLLAPNVIETFVAANGKVVTLETLLRQSLPVGWRAQEALLS